MKRYLVTLIVLFVCIAVNAFSPLDNKSRAIIEQIKSSMQFNEFSKEKVKSLKSTSVGSLYYPVIIKVSNESVVDDLLSLGTKVFHKRNNLLLACVPYSKLDTISRLPLVNRMSLSQPMSITLDKAKLMTNVSKLHSAIDLPKSYSGEGVVVGITDVGFDPSHVAFNDGRLKRLVCYDELRAERNDMRSTEELSSWTTDDSLEWHACHVAGILAGGYCGNDYSGVATKSDIVITTSSLYDMAILSGAEDIVEYAKQNEKPAVINMSLGYNLGPHDGSSLFNQYLDLIGEEAIVCLSSGNEGNKRVYIPFEATDEKNELKTFVYDNPDVCGIKMRGAIDMWSADARDFLIALTIYDRITKEFVYTSPYMEASNNEASSWGIASSTVATDNDISIPLFDSVLKGAVRVYCSTNLDNNRYNVYATIDVENLQRDESGKLGRYCIGFVMRAEQGVKIEAYADGHGVIFHSLGVDGYTQGNPSRSISDLACSKNVIVVGASSSRNTTPQVDGNIKEYNFSENQVANFSSYGTLNDGRKLPHFCAPGNMIVAPINSYYTAKMNEVDLQKLASVATVSGKKYYWISECGTSMASPHAAGVIACWVQADSSLTVHDVIEIAQSTTCTDFRDINDPKWGAGNIDAYAGLKEVLKRSGVGSVIHDAKNELLLKQLDYKTFLVEMPFAQIETIELYSISGVKVCSQQGPLVNAQSLASGVYLIKVLHSKGESIERILIK